MSLHRCLLSAHTFTFGHLLSFVTFFVALASASGRAVRFTRLTTSRTLIVRSRNYTEYSSFRPGAGVSEKNNSKDEAGKSQSATKAQNNVASLVRDLLGDQFQKPSLPPLANGHTGSSEFPAKAATFIPRVTRYVPPETPTERWRLRSRQGDSQRQRANDSYVREQYAPGDGNSIIAFKPYHKELLEVPGRAENSNYRSLDYIKYNIMRSQLQILTVPTADTPGTTLLLQFDNKRYLVGNLSEGTQRASIQMGAKLLKVNECFITSRTEWQNTGGLIGMILTLADASASSSAASQEEIQRKAKAKSRNAGLDEEEAVREVEAELKRQAKNVLTLFGAPNLNHTLATARRFVFRKGMPVHVHEITEEAKEEGKKKWEPYWADENIKVWAMSVLPAQSNGAATKSNGAGTVSPRKRSIDEVYGTGAAQKNGTANGELTPEERDALTVKAVVGEMFDSSWRLDTLHETPLSEVKMPAAVFVRNADTNKIQKYDGPMPGGSKPVPDITVLVRKPWPGALVETLPPTQPAQEAISYIIRNHRQRGKFNPQRAKELKVPSGPLWSKLSSGQNVQNDDGETIMPDMVLGESKEGGGFAVVDLPDHAYVEPLINRPEWRRPEVMAGVGAIIWNIGRGVLTNTALVNFMKEMKHLKHVVSSANHCPNQIALDSVAASTVRLRQVDPLRYTVPDHCNDLRPKLPSGQPVPVLDPLPDFAILAARGQMITLEPSFSVSEKQLPPPLDISQVESETSPEVLEEARKAIQAIENDRSNLDSWAATLPPQAKEAEIITLGTGSALPSKYRNVSATLVRVPGWGSMLFDCGENTLGQLKRVFDFYEMRDILRELKVIFISHMHADHHLGTVSVIKAWYEAAHLSKPASTSSPPSEPPAALFEDQQRLAVVSEPAMLHWLYEYASVEDYGFSRLAPLCISPALPSRNQPSRLNWFMPPRATGESNVNSSSHQSYSPQTHVPPSLLGLQDVQAVSVQHCHGARAVSFTWPSSFKVSYSGDCRPSKTFSQIGKGSTVCIHEATFDDELQGDAEAKNHSTTSEALGVAGAMGAKACVLTHFSQRYQKVPVLESTNAEEEEEQVTEPMAEEPEPGDEDIAAPLEDAAPAASSAADTVAPAKPLAADANGNVVKLKVRSDMKVCVAFDYMRVKVGEIAQMEKFTPALLRLFAEEEKPEVSEVAQSDGAKKKGKGGKKEKGGQNEKSRRNN